MPATLFNAAVAFNTHGSARACVRCGKELTDAASMEAGIGPVCRKLDNHLLAQTIPAHVGLASASIAQVNVEALDEAVRPTVEKVALALNAPDAATRSDWRTEIKRMEWALSFPQTHAAAFAPMLAVVKALGYVGLASLWSGEAATGLATIRFEGGRLFVKGPRNKAANAAIRAITGRRFHGDTKEWSVPAAQADAFKSAIDSHYPVNTGLSAALDAAKSAPVAAPTAVAAPAPKTSITQVGGQLVVKSPYNTGFINALKANLPFAARKWDGANKAWVVGAAYLADVQALIQKFYNESATVVGAAVAAPVVAPAPAKPVAKKSILEVLPF